MLFGFAYTTFLYVAAYQAGLAAFMVSKSVPGALIDKFTDVERIPGGRICMLEAVQSSIQQRYDWPASKIKGADDFGPMLETLYRGKHGCVAALIGVNELKQIYDSQSQDFTYCADPADEKQFSKCVAPVTTDPVRINLSCKCEDAEKNAANGECPEECPFTHRYCNMMLVDDLDFSLSVPVGMPVAMPFLDYFSAWLVTYKLDGTMTTWLDEELNSKYCKVCGKGIFIDECVNATADKPPDPPKEPAPLYLGDMIGTYILCLGIMGAGLLLWCFQRLLAMLPGTKTAPDPAEGDQGAEAAAEVEGELGFADPPVETDPVKKEVEELKDTISAMLDKLKAIEANAQG